MNLFWLQPGVELALLRNSLAPGGSLHLYFEPPSAAKGREIRERLAKMLPAHGFEVRECEPLSLARGQLLALVATPAR